MDIISTTLPINQDNLFELQKLIEAKLSDPRNKWKITYPLCNHYGYCNSGKGSWLLKLLCY